MSEETSDPSQSGPPLPGPSGLRVIQRSPRIRLHVGLFLATVLTTMVAGAFQSGVDLFTHPWEFYKGIPFAASILAILTAHEMGHYFMSRRHRLNVSLPYFLPGLPFPPPLPGTFGALIRIRSPILDKRALLDIGCSGPLIGLVVVVPVLVIGLKLSPVVSLFPKTGAEITLGESLLFKLVCWLTLGPLGPEKDIAIHPVAFAGWLGLLITALNLLPVGQLDGGHVIYALFPKWHRAISFASLGILIIFGILKWEGWLVWAALLTFLGVRHPPPSCDWIPLDPRRRILGALTILVFVLTFTPMPFDLRY